MFVSYRYFFAVVLLALGTGRLYAQELDPVPEPQENPVTESKRILGKILFWDEQLSSDNTVACATCHQPAAGGADARQGLHPGPDGIFNTDDDIIGSSGIALRNSDNQPTDSAVFGRDVQVTGRATPSFIMAMYADELFWDGRAGEEFVDPLDNDNTVISNGGALENQALGPILSSVEMGHEGRDWADVTDKLERVVPLRLATELTDDMAAALDGVSDYATLFASAFGDDQITPVRIAMAIASYERTLLADQTPWDLFIAGDQTAMTDAQINGWELFDGQTVCDNCHTPPLFTNDNFHNLGLRPSEEDLGREAVTGNNNDRGEFKTPSLRNVGLRPSLMHVGWINGVHDAVDFYNSNAEDNGHSQFEEDQSNIPRTGGRGYDSISFFVGNGGGDTQQKLDVIDFMINGLTDPRVANEEFPFDRPVLATDRAAMVKLMSYNLLATNWTDARADTLAQIISDNSPDVLGLQEALVTQKEDLLDRLGDDYDFFTFSDENSHPILLKKDVFTVLESGSFDEPVFCVVERFINFVVLEQQASGERFVFYNSQFCPSQAQFDDGEPTAQERNEQHAASLVEAINANTVNWPDLPVLAVGDLNASSASVTMQYLLGQGALTDGNVSDVLLDDSWDTVYPGAARTAAVDWILHTPTGLTLVENITIDNDLTGTASDHLPVLANLIVEGTAAVNGDPVIDPDTDTDTDPDADADADTDPGAGTDNGAGGGNGDGAGDSDTATNTGAPVQAEPAPEGGGGCMMLPEGGNDPVLAILLMFALLMLLRRRQQVFPRAIASAQAA